MAYQGGAGTLLLTGFDTTVATWTGRVEALGNATTLIAFITEASQVLYDKTIFQDLINSAAVHGRRWAQLAAATVQGPVLQLLSSAAIAESLDTWLKPEEWGSMCPWPAVV